MNEQEKQSKKLYQRWWVWVIGIFILFVVWRTVSMSIDNARTKDIPNVMGVQYTDAQAILEDSGFIVSAFETDAESILANDTFNRSVKKGEVFKINNETSPNYSYGSTKEKKIRIYYAKNDYTYIKPTAAPKEEKPSNTETEAPPQNTIVGVQLF